MKRRRHKFKKRKSFSKSRSKGVRAPKIGFRM